MRQILSGKRRRRTVGKAKVKAKDKTSQVEEDLKGAVLKDSGKSPSVDEGASIEQNRDILFGAQIRDFEKRFARVEERLIREVTSLRDESRKRFDSLESYIGKEVECTRDCGGQLPEKGIAGVEIGALAILTFDEAPLFVNRLHDLKPLVNPIGYEHYVLSRRQSSSQRLLDLTGRLARAGEQPVRRITVYRELVHGLYVQTWVGTQLDLV